ILSAIGVGTIVDNHDPLPVITVTAGIVYEGDSGITQMPFAVRLSKAGGQTVSLRCSTRAGTAKPGEDFVSTNVFLQLPPGITNATFSVGIIGDTINEPDEFFVVDLSEVTNATLAYTNSSGVILNDDAVPGKLDHFTILQPGLPIVQGQPAPFVI